MSFSRQSGRVGQVAEADEGAARPGVVVRGPLAGEIGQEDLLARPGKLRLGKPRKLRLLLAGDVR